MAKFKALEISMRPCFSPSSRIRRTSLALIFSFIKVLGFFHRQRLIKKDGWMNTDYTFDADFKLKKNFVNSLLWFKKVLLNFIV